MERQLHCMMLYQVLSSANAFFLDTEHPIIFQNKDPSFGYQVEQMGRGVIVSAPLHQETTNKTGQLYRCKPETASCSPIPIPGSPDDIKMSLGLSLAVKQNPPQLLVCGPSLQRTCGENIYVNGRCYHISENPPIMRSLPKSLPECSVRGLDVVFLIDGSGSIKKYEFILMLRFISRVMKAFQDTDTKFALMQYSHKFEIHFDFNGYSQSEDRTQLTNNIVQHIGGTHTSTAILMVMYGFHDYNLLYRQTPTDSDHWQLLSPASCHMQGWSTAHSQ
ncbi:integrin alpha-D-like [Pyxicephalus adspersus]|uniref:integrin alpha-D-like n=1 Tax=Pyxicephalus adspersus TaxID=30357 RepID=UPI003B590515